MIHEPYHCHPGGIYLALYFILTIMLFNFMEIDPVAQRDDTFETSSLIL